MHYISAKPINVDIAEKILLAGGNPNIENRWAVTPLYSLVCNNNCNWKEQKYKLLKLFMKYGGDKDYKASQKDTTPLQMAYEFADAKMIEILEGKMEKSPLAMTVKVAIEEGEIEKVKKLLNDKPNNINELASIGWWLHTAASCQQLEIAEFLIDLGVDVNFVIFKKGNALVNAAGTGNIAMMELFIQKGIEISCTLDHFNPIMAAVGRDKLEAVKYLLEKEKKMLPPQKYKELIKIMIDKADICESKDVLTYLGVIL